MTLRLRKSSTAIFAGTMVAVAPLVAACGSSSSDSYESWAATDGAAGRINLDDVQAAFELSSSATDFETRVNEIYEGDGIILIRAWQDDTGLTLEGWEDLNNNSSVDDSGDDLLFSIVNRNGSDNELRGHHANSYYHSSFGGGDFLFGYMLGSAMNRGPYVYTTPVASSNNLRAHRASYRGSSAYNSQVARNSRYTARQQSFAGSRYQDSRRSVSSSRQSYQQTQRSSGAFRSSNAISRTGSSVSTFSSRSSAAAATRSGGSGGGFRGGGGQVNLRRPGKRLLG